MNRFRYHFQVGAFMVVLCGFAIAAAAGADKPSSQAGAQVIQLVAGQSWEYELEVEDGATVTLSGAPAGMTLEGKHLSWTPTKPEKHSIAVNIVSGKTKTRQRFSFVVTAPPATNRAVAATQNTTRSVQLAPGQAWAFELDVDRDAVVTLSGAPAGMTLDGRHLSWTPTEPQVHSMAVNVLSGKSKTRQRFTFTVVAPVAAKPEGLGKGSQPGAGALAGTWKAVDVQGAGGLANDLKSGELTLGADKSGRFRNNMVGTIAGTWALDGQGAVVFTPAAGGTVPPKAFAFDGKRLVERVGDSIRVVYERAGGVAGPSAAAAALPPADFTMSAEELVKALDAGSGAADKYNGKTLEIRGAIADARMEGSQQTPVVTLGGGPLKGIECWMVRDEASSKLAKGQTVTVRGKADLGFIRRLNEASLVTSGRN